MAERDRGGDGGWMTDRGREGGWQDSTIEIENGTEVVDG